MYLNQCKAVSTKIDHCKIYSSKNRCETCQTGYFLSNNECNLILAINCLLFENETKCRSCTFEFPYLDTDFNCKKNPLIPNCKYYSTVNKCEKCEDSFYLNSESKCVTISPIVQNCSIYSSESKCITCVKGYELITESSTETCNKINGVDPFCKNAVSGDNRCAVCKSGYVLIDGICQKCDHQNPGCAVCDSGNLGTCKMCTSGYTMDTDGMCHVNQTIRDGYIKISYDV